MKNSLVYLRYLFLTLFCCLNMVFNRMMICQPIGILSFAELSSIAIMHFNIHKQPHLQLNPNTDISAIRQLRVSQGYGDPLYKKFAPSSLLRFYGYTGFAITTITRQTVQAFNIASYLFPSPFLPDVIGRDINAHAKTAMEANGARLGMLFNPIANQTENNIYGILEMDFTGVQPQTPYIGKIRNAFGEITWGSGTFLFGQYFHPLFLRHCFPRVVNLNQGAPFEPQALVPQVRLTQLVKDIEFSIVAAGEAYIESFGPATFLDATGGVQSLDFIQDAIVPNWNLLIKWLFPAGFIGGSIDYKRLVPRLVSYKNYKVNEHIDSLIGEIFSHTIFKWGEINFKAVYSQNGSDQLLISGFAVKTVDPVTDFRTYANTAAVSSWLDIFYIFWSGTMELGLFTGGTYNLGASTCLYIDPTINQPIIYALDAIAQTLSYSVRVSPRYSFSEGAFRIGIELAWDRAAFGTPDRYARVVNAIPVHAFSYLLSIDYIF